MPEDHDSLDNASLSVQPSVVRYTPTLSFYSSSRSSDNIDHGPRRYYGRPFGLSLLPHAMANPTGPGSRSSQQPQFTQQQLQAIAVAQHRQVNPLVPMAGRPAEEFRDPLALEAARVTPGVDDTPYIQYALEALTKEREAGSTKPSSASSDGRPTVAGTSRPYSAHQNAPITAQPVVPMQDATRRSEEQRVPLLPGAGPRPSSRRSSLSTLVRGKDKGVRFLPRQAAPDAWEPVDPESFRDGREKINPRLEFKPKILRRAPMTTLMILCMMMITALIFSAVYSQRHTGLWDYVGTIYSGQYFLFRVVPAILGAVLLLWAQCAVTTMIRMRPFAKLAATGKAARQDAIFDDLYPTSFLRPHLVGPWHVWVPNLVTWLMNFTLPLQSCLFTVMYVDGHWRWATVQGVAWTLVALYLLLLGAVIIEMSYWLVDKTGVMWDPRSIADVAALVANSNTLGDYRQTEILGTRDHLRQVLYRRRADRLAYWGWADRDRPDDLWYALGHHNEWADPAVEDEMLDEKGRPRSHESRALSKPSEARDPWGDVELEGSAMQPLVRYRHLPFCLKNLPLIIFIVLGFWLLVALFVVSFLPQTHLAEGFLPLLPAAPTRGAFSAADFLYSFLPALLGLVLFVAFQDLDLHLRIRQPWGELSAPPAGGALPEASVLADYAACYPLQAPLHALRNRHWRVAAVSLLSTLLALLPAFAGAVFMALTPADGVVRVYPQVGLLALTLALLVAYWLALVAVFPRRQALRLPHDVTCLAEVISFVANDDCVRDEAFRGMVRNKTTLVGKLGADRRDEDKPRWTLHTGGSGARDERLGVRRVRTGIETTSADPAAARLMGGRTLYGVAPPGPDLGAGPAVEARREARRSGREAVRVSPQYSSPARDI